MIAFCQNYSLMFFALKELLDLFSVRTVLQSTTSTFLSVRLTIWEIAHNDCNSFAVFLKQHTTHVQKRTLTNITLKILFQLLHSLRYYPTKHSWTWPTTGRKASPAQDQSTYHHHPA